MRTTRQTLALLAVLIAAGNALGQEKPALREIDRVRLAEAFNVGDRLGDQLWAGWSKAPFAVLLVTQDKEFPKEVWLRILQLMEVFVQQRDDPGRGSFGGSILCLPELAAYLEGRAALKKLLSADDYKYLSFQLWKEGMARYTEDRIAHLAAAKYQPSREFRALKDFTTFKAVAEQVRAGIDRELSTLNLQTYKRVAFYPFGAGEGLLLDRARPRWRAQYFVQKFDNEVYFK